MLTISLTLRIAIFLIACWTTFYITRKVRKGQIGIEHSLFWILLSFFLLLTSIFPTYIVWIAKLLGVYSTSNVIFLIVIFVLMLKLFSNSILLSKLEHKINILTQEIAIKDLEDKQDDQK